MATHIYKTCDKCKQKRDTATLEVPVLYHPRQIAEEDSWTEKLKIDLCLECCIAIWRVYCPTPDEETGKQWLEKFIPDWKQIWDKQKYGEKK